jgi:hypothetical protein
LSRWRRTSLRVSDFTSASVISGQSFSSFPKDAPDKPTIRMSEQYWPENVGETMKLTKFRLRTVDVKGNPDFVLSTVKLRHLKVRKSPVEASNVTQRFLFVDKRVESCLSLPADYLA